MISSKKEMYNYIECDLKAQQAYPITARMRLTSLFHPCIWKFQVKLRKMEYLYNCRKRNIFEKLIFIIKYMRFQNYGMKLGFSIPLNVFGSGLCLCHADTIIVNQNCRIGANAVVNKNVPDHVTMAGVLAKIINENGSEGLIIYDCPISQLKIQQ